MSEFLAMGGYGAYVWPSYAVFVLALLWDALVPLLHERRVRRQLERKLRREAQRARP